jgi:pimeloyl-ACP methyl ester carboxylesterase
MSAAISRDGTPIGFTRQGSGPPLVLVDGALCHRGFGPMPKLAAALSSAFTVYTYDRRGRGESGDTPPYAVDREIDDLAAVIGEAGGSAHVCGLSSGAVLALDAAARGVPIRRLALYEAPLIVDGTRPPIPPDYTSRLRELLAANRRGEAVAHFMSLVGVPKAGILFMRLMPMWSKLKAVAPTLAYDTALTASRQIGKPLSPAEWASVDVPTLVIAGGKSDAWMQNANAALAAAVPGATYSVLEGQNHMVKASALAPLLKAWLVS